MENKKKLPISWRSVLEKNTMFNLFTVIFYLINKQQSINLLRLKLRKEAIRSTKPRRKYVLKANLIYVKYYEGFWMCVCLAKKKLSFSASRKNWTEHRCQNKVFITVFSHAQVTNHYYLNARETNIWLF